MDNASKIDCRNKWSTFTPAKRMVPTTEASSKVFGLSAQLLYRRPSGRPQPFQALIAQKESRVPILASNRGEF
jgi:hypothetical protein